jgi:hypothetical protein
MLVSVWDPAVSLAAAGRAVEEEDSVEVAEAALGADRRGEDLHVEVVVAMMMAIPWVVSFLSET